MNNYQLYRSNVLLGGQMKYDLIVSQKSGELFADDIHISAISDSAPVLKHSKESLLNWSHQENIKKYYSNNSSSFYKDFANPMLTSLYPLPEDYTGETHESTYEAGCRRMNYNDYGTQFEYFCPLWIEHLKENDDIIFKLYIKSTPNSKQPITFKTIKLSERLRKYFQNYIKHIGIEKGCDWVFDINQSSCVATGFNIASGLVSEIQLNKLYSDLIGRERPLLEFNNMIINELNKNSMIVKQLFNFNFCFNLEDVVSPYVLKEIVTAPIWVTMDVFINGEKLDEMDFFSNHEFIKKTYLNLDDLTITGDEQKTLLTVKHFSGQEINDINVLNYLQDNNYIDLIDKNKILQNTHHWCLSSNPNYHFNFYGGFSSIYKSGDEVINIPYYNSGTADLISRNPKIFSPWCNSYNVSTDSFESVINKLFDDIKEQKINNDLFSVFSKDSWVKGIHYTNSEVKNSIPVMFLFTNLEAVKDGINNLKILTQINFKSWMFLYDNTSTKTTPKMLILFNSQTNHIIFIADIQDQCQYSFKQFINNENIQGINNLCVKDLLKILKKPNNSSKKNILLSNGLKIVKAPSPSTTSSEVEYFKTTTTAKLIRELGKIKPYFISKNNELLSNYQYKKLKCGVENDKSQNEDTIISPDYKKFADSAYQPKYPSLKYFSIEGDTMIYDLNSDPGGATELHNYKDNKIRYLYPVMDFKNTFNIDSNKNADIRGFVETQLTSLYQISKDDGKKVLAYISSKYTWNAILLSESQGLDNSKLQTYEIQIKLK